MREMKYTLTHKVGADETAATVGSGLLPVYATPSVVALMEHAACLLIGALPADADGALGEGMTTVGTRMAIDHVKACLPDETVSAEAELKAVDGRRYELHIEVTDSAGQVLATADHTRFAVNSERFMQKLEKKG